MKANRKTLEVLLRWYATGERGASSEAIARRLLGIRGQRPSHPLDPGDMRRCMLLLRRLPAGTIRRMRGASPEWTVLVDHWHELVRMIRADVKVDPHSAPTCYARMRELLYPPEVPR